jgi:hypothetical protein
MLRSKKDFRPTDEERYGFNAHYSVYSVSADSFNCITIRCQLRNTTKEKAVAFRNKYCDGIKKSNGKRVKYVITSSDEDVDNLRAKADAINAVSIPKRNKYMAELSVKKRAEIDREAERYQNLKAKYDKHMSAVGWHYDNYQRVNEYKGTMRG